MLYSSTVRFTFGYVQDMQVFYVYVCILYSFNALAFRAARYHIFLPDFAVSGVF